MGVYFVHMKIEFSKKLEKRSPIPFVDFVKKLEPNKLLFIKNKILKSLSVNDLSEIEDISNLL